MAIEQSRNRANNSSQSLELQRMKIDADERRQARLEMKNQAAIERERIATNAKMEMERMKFEQQEKAKERALSQANEIRKEKIRLEELKYKREVDALSRKEREASRKTEMIGGVASQIIGKLLQ